MNTTIEMQNKLEILFVEIDQQFIKRQKEWALKRMEATKQFKNSEEFKKMGVYEKYDRLFAIAGGKTWYNSLYGRSETDICKFIEKNCKTIIKRRNASIVKKLEKAEATKIKGSNFAKTSDGFHGSFNVETNAGSKTINIETILAGGYNIQCLHVRTLVKISK